MVIVICHRQLIILSEKDVATLTRNMEVRLGKVMYQLVFEYGLIKNAMLKILLVKSPFSNLPLP